LHHNDNGVTPCPGTGADTLTNDHFASAAGAFAQYPGLLDDPNLIIAMPAAPGTCLTPNSATPNLLPFSSDAFVAFLHRQGVTAQFTVLNAQPVPGGHGNTALVVGSSWTNPHVANPRYPPEYYGVEGQNYGVFEVTHASRGIVVTFVVATTDGGATTKHENQMYTLMNMADQIAAHHPTFIAADFNDSFDQTLSGDWDTRVNAVVRNRTRPLTLDVQCNTPQGTVANQSGQIIGLLYDNGAGAGQLLPMGNYLGWPPSQDGRIIVPGVAPNHPMLGVRMRFPACASGVLCSTGCSNLDDTENCGTCGTACTNGPCVQGQCKHGVQSCCPLPHQMACGCDGPHCEDCECLSSHGTCGDWAASPAGRKHFLQHKKTR
jgi:hypothetical protein